MEIREGTAGHYKLRDDAGNWPTPCPFDAATGHKARAEQKEGSMHAVSLHHLIQNWPTPDASVATGRNQSPSPNAAVRPNLAELVKKWPTPKAQCANSPGKHGEGGADLQTEAMKWATPTARDWKDGTCGPETWGKKGENSLLGRQVVPNRSIGRESSNGDPTLRPPSLNPEFVCWLMGFPERWAVIESTSSELSAMRFYLSWRQRHLLLLEGD